MGSRYRTHQDTARILVEKVDEEGEVIDMRLSHRTDLLRLQDLGTSNEGILRLFNSGDATPGGIFDHAQAALSVIWVTTDGAPTGHVVEMPFEGTYPTGRSVRANLTGYTPRVLATATPGVFWGVWVQGIDPNQRVRGQFFTK